MSVTEQLNSIKRALGLDTLVFLDWETFYKSKANNNTKSFSLKSLTYAEYIFGERFHETGIGITEDMGDIEYHHGHDAYEDIMEELRLRREQGERIGIVAHNTQFDASICNWRWKVSFDFYLDTMLMAKYLGAHLQHSLAKCAEREFPDDPALRKGNDLADVDGIKYEYITDEQHEALGRYAKQDVNLMRRLFFRYFDQIPADEIKAMHITLRGAVEPQFAIRRDLLEEVLEDESVKEAKAIVEAIKYCNEHGLGSLTKTSFSSNQQYAELLSRLGLTVPKKVSKTTGAFTDALGKNDPEYIKLQIEAPQHALVYKAREVAKSTIAASRATRMINVADMFHAAGFTDADMPFFLNYYGAGQTGRWSGGQKLNQQNNTRGGKHRLSMLAPEGYQIGVCDLSNIELRVNLWFCGQQNLLEEFRKDPDFDLYSEIASDIFGYQVSKKTHPDERQMGKAAALGLGFAMGWFGFQNYLASGPLGMEPMFKDDAFCRNVKNAYDQKHNAIVAMWHFIANNVMRVIVQGGELRFGPNNSYLATKDKIVLPSGRTLQYANARYKGEETQGGVRTKVVFDSDNYNRWGQPTPKYMWHGLIIENIAQATARDILMFQLVQIEDALQSKGYGWLMGSVHDEGLAALKDDVVEEAYSEMERIMAIPPPWAAGLPLANEGGYAKEYSK